MKNLSITLIALVSLLLPISAGAQLVTHQGGTGLVDISQGSIPFGSVFNLRLATSSAFQWNNALSKLSFTFGSTTALSATTLCLSADCKTAWPTGGAGTVSTSSSETANFLPFWTSTSGTPALLSGGSALFQWLPGLLAIASSTIGNGTQAGGLTISGGATTTGDAYFGGNINIPNTAATTTIGGNLFVTGTADVENSILGALSFANDAGTNNGWMNLPIVTATNGTAESYNANIGGTAALTIYGTSNGSGGVSSYGVGIGTTAPGAKLSVYGGMSVGADTAYSQIAPPTDGMIIKGNVGIGTTSPFAKLSVMAGGDYASHAASTLFAIGSTTQGVGTTTLFSVDSGGNVNEGTANSTTTMNGGLMVTGTADVENSILGALSFANDAGTNNGWMNLPIVAATNGTAESYNANIGGTAALTIYGTSNGSGGVSSYGVGVGTTSPFAQLSVATPNGATGSQQNLFVIASSTQTATMTLFSVRSSGHIIASSTAPILSSCGTSPFMTGDDSHGYITVGSVAATGCTITFAQPYVTRPECTLTNESMSVVNAMTYTVSSTTIVVTQTGLTGDVLDYHCEGF